MSNRVADWIGLGTLGWFFSPQIIRIATDQGELVIDAKDQAVEVEVLQGGELVRVIDTKPTKASRLIPVSIASS